MRTTFAKSNDGLQGGGGAETGGAAFDPAALEAAFGEVVARVAPSVVGVCVQRRVVDCGLDGALSSGRRVIVNGSGCVVDADGLILTNEHVVQRAEEIEVVLHDGQRLDAHVIGADVRSDLAVLAVERSGLTPVQWCDWSRVARGQWTIAVGNPYGLGDDGQACVSVGVISNLGRRLPGLGEEDDRLYTNMIQTTAAINPGNSGGPLFNLRGELIGVVAAVYVRAGVDEGVGFAIPMSPSRRELATQLCAGREIEYGYVGAVVRDDEQQLPHVIDIEPGGPADEAGLRIGDLIVDCDGAAVAGADHFAELIGHAPVGANVTIGVERDGEALAAVVAIARRETTRVAWMRGEALLWRGVRLADRRQAGTLGAQRGLEQGVIVLDVAPESAAGDALFIGDVITAVESEPVEGLPDFDERVRGQRGPVNLAVAGRGVVAVMP